MYFHIQLFKSVVVDEIDQEDGNCFFYILPYVPRSVL